MITATIMDIMITVFCFILDRYWTLIVINNFDT